jgi:integrase
VLLWRKKVNNRNDAILSIVAKARLWHEFTSEKPFLCYADWITMNLPVHESAPMPASLSEGGLSVLGARGDADAVAIWLQARGSRSIHTQRTYRRIGERLLVWLARTEKTLAEMTVTDAQAHLDSLRSPDVSLLIPRNEVGKLAESLYKSQTLKRPLSAQGFVFSRTVLSQLFQYLMTAGYVRSNVFALTEVPEVVERDAADKVLSQEGSKYLWEWLRPQELPIAPHKRLVAARNRWVCALLYYTGIRSKEAVAGRMADVVRDSDGWQLRVLGKGAKIRRVTVSNTLGRELMRFREAMGVPPWPTPDDPMPLIPHVRGKDRATTPISSRMLHKLVSELCKAAASASDDPHVADELRRMSVHWFRHTSATHRLEAGARLETTQQELGHANPKTTLLYAQIAGRARREDAELFEAAVAARGKQEKSR